MSNLVLYKNSNKTYQVEILDVSRSVTVVGAWFAIKAHASDDDAHAIKLKEITSVPCADGVIVNSGGDTNPILEFSILGSEISALYNNVTYISSVKVLLSDGSTATPPASIRPVKIRDGGIQKTTIGA